MSLCKGIKFRHLSSQLTKTETKQFLNELSNDSNNIINKALFEFCIKSSNNEQGNTINNLLSKIIRSRKKKPKRIRIENIKLDIIPKQLIGNISSFLYQYDYINFSKTNRFIFLGCNTPNLLQELNLINIENYSYINLKLFQSIKTFKLNLNKFNELVIPSILNGETIMNNLKHIELFADEKKDIDINSFVTQNWLNTNNVTTLCLKEFGIPPSPLNAFNSDKFLTLLTKFSNIEYCQFRGVHINNLIDANKLSTTWTKLKAMNAMTDPRNAQLLLNTFGNNLNFLSLYDFPGIDYNLSDINFKHLQELRLCLLTPKPIKNILQTAVNVKKILITLFSNSASSTSNPEQVKESIIKSITTCKQLKCIGFVDNNKLFESILYGIEKGLFKTKKIKRDTMKIYIDSKTSLNPMEFISNIVNVINELKMSEIKQFIFILVFANLSDKIVLQLENEFKNLLSNVTLKRYENGFTISNKVVDLVDIMKIAQKDY